MRLRWFFSVLLLFSTACYAGSEVKPGDLPEGVTIFPQSDSEYCRILEFTDPADVFVQGPLPDLRMWTPAIKDGGKLAIVSGKAGDYNVMVFPQQSKPGEPRIKAFTTRLGPAKPPAPPKPPTPPTPPAPANPYQSPSAEWQQATAAVRVVKLSRDDATALAKLYGQAFTQAAAGVLKTTDMLRDYLVTEGVKLSLKGRYAGLAQAIDKVLTDRLGLAVRPLEQGDKDAMAALAWAVWETGK